MAPRKTQKVTKKKPVRRTRPKKKLAPPSCTNSGHAKQPKLTVKKPEATSKCPHCNGLGKIVKKKLKKEPRCYFPYFFQHVCKRARESNVVQHRKITMKRAADCWNILTKEQKDDFKLKAQKTLGIGGGAKPKGSGPGKRGGGPKGEDNQDIGPSLTDILDDLECDTLLDVKPSGTDCGARASPPNDPNPMKQCNDQDTPNDDDQDTPNDDDQDTPNDDDQDTPNDDDQVPFGRFDPYRLTGNSV